MRQLITVVILAEESKGHILRGLRRLTDIDTKFIIIIITGKEPEILNATEFNLRVDRAKFVFILQTSPPGTGVILRFKQRHKKPFGPKGP